MSAPYSIGDTVLGNWTLKRKIGEGSFGKVFEAERTDFGQTYHAAVKIITIPQNEGELRSVQADSADDESVSEYFRSFVEELTGEFALMSEIRGHSNIVSYEDHAVVPHEQEIGWDIMIRMELLTPLLDRVKGAPMTRADVIGVGVDLCRALELCRRENIIHRDIKPENIFLSKSGSYKLGDFGIARTAERTTSGMSKKGTYSYMAPEVYMGRAYGPGVDLYSLGLVLYWLLNDRRTPFLPPSPAPVRPGDRENALRLRMSGAPVPPPKNADPALAAIVLKACAYDPRNRYADPAEMREALEALLRGGETPAEAPRKAPVIPAAPERTPVPQPGTEPTPTPPEKTEFLLGQSGEETAPAPPPQPGTEPTPTPPEKTERTPVPEEGTALIGGGYHRPESPAPPVSRPAPPPKPANAPPEGTVLIGGGYHRPEFQNQPTVRSQPVSRPEPGLQAWEPAPQAWGPEAKTATSGSAPVWMFVLGLLWLSVMAFATIYEAYDVLWIGTIAGVLVVVLLLITAVVRLKTPTEVGDKAINPDAAEVHLSDGDICDISPLSRLKNLRTLDLRSNNISDLTPLRGLINLEYLDLDYNNISDLTPLRGLTNLKVLYLRYNNVSDLTPLKGLIKLEYLYLDDNSLTQAQVNDLRAALPNCYIRFRPLSSSL